MITLKFQKDPRGCWGYIPNFSEYRYSVKECESIDFWHSKLSEQPLEDIVKFSEYVKKLSLIHI